MAATTQQIERCSVATVAGFTGALLTNASVMTLVPTVDGFVNDTPDQLFDEGREANQLGTATPPIPTVREGKGDFTLRMYGGSKSDDGASGDTAPTTFNNQLLIENFCGAAAHHAFAGTTVAAPGTAQGKTAPMIFTAVTGLAVMDLIRVGGELACVMAISGSNVTLDHDVTTFSAGTVIYGAFTCLPTMGEYTTYLGINIERDGDARLYQPSRITEMEISKVSAKEGCRMKFGFQSADWSPGFTPNAIPTDSFRANPAMVGIGSPALVNFIQTAMTEFSFKFGIKHEEAPATSGLNGRQAYAATDLADCSGGFTEYYADSRFTTDFQSGGNFPLLFDIANPTGNIGKARASYGLFIPNASIKVARAAVGNRRAAKVSFRANTPTAAQVAAGFTKPWALGVIGGV